MTSKILRTLSESTINVITLIKDLNINLDKFEKFYKEKYNVITNSWESKIINNNKNY